MQAYSVVIPAYNAARTLADALQSVFSQSLPPAEVIVVDDGSDDETAALAAAFDPGVRVLKQQNSGPGSATSYGMRQAGSPLVATLDADDIWLENKLEMQLEKLAGNPVLSAVFCKQRQFRHGYPDDGRGEIRSGLNRSSMLIYRHVFEAVGDIADPPGKVGDMIDWLARVRETGFQFDEIDQVLVLRRIIGGSLSSGGNPDKNKGYLAVAHRAMMRRRAGQNVE